MNMAFRLSPVILSYSCFRFVQNTRVARFGGQKTIEKVTIFLMQSVLPSSTAAQKQQQNRKQGRGVNDTSRKVSKTKKLTT